MPHLSLEFSNNLRDEDIGGLCTQLAKTMVAQQFDGKPVFPIGGVRVRAHAAEFYAIADGNQPDAGFVHASMKVAAGRAPEALKAACDAVFETMKAHFASAFERQGLALSLEFSEFSEAGTLKHSNLHARFKKA
jgi:5-carboxymethyl-2-hydroxymuconate isomerase